MSQDLNKANIHKNIVLSTTGYVYKPKQLQAYDEDDLEFLLNALRLKNEDLEDDTAFDKFFARIYEWDK